VGKQAQFIVEVSPGELFFEKLIVFIECPDIRSRKVIKVTEELVSILVHPLILKMYCNINFSLISFTTFITGIDMKP
jgi:hypothetical protein